MRNLKRVLSLALASVMLLGMMVIGAGAADYTDNDSISQIEAAQVMEAIGVMQGNDKGEFLPTADLTREAAAKIITYLLLGKKTADGLTAATAPFNDVEAGRWSAGSIAYCVANGIISGDGKGNFFPTATVTGSQFAKMLLCADGYNAETEKFVGSGYELNIAKIVSATKLNTGIASSLSSTLTREEAARMALNVLSIPAVEYTGGMNVTTPDGTVVNNGGVRKNVTHINGLLTVDSTFAYLYQPNLNKTPNQTGTYSRPSHTWTNGKDKIGTYADDVEQTYTAGAKATDIRNDLSGYALDTRTDVYINGVSAYSLTGVKATDDTTLGNLVKNGRLVEFYTAYDVSKSDYYVSDIIVVDTVLAKISSINTVTNEIMYTTESISSAVQNIGHGVSSIKKADNKDMYEKLAEMKAGDYVLLTFSNSVANTNVIASVAVPETVTGTFTGYVSSTGKRTVGGNTYDTAYISVDKLDDKSNGGANPLMSVGNEYVTYLDTYGNVIYASVEAASAAKTGYILSSERTGNVSIDGEFTYNARILFTDGTQQWVKIASIADSAGTYLAKSNNSSFTGYFDGNALNGKFVNYSVRADGSYALTMIDDGNVGTLDNSVGSAAVDKVYSFSGISITKDTVDFTGAASAVMGSGKTIFLVKTGDGTYRAYNGIKSIPGWTGVDGSLIVGKTSTAATVVVIDSGAIQTTQDMVYILSTSYETKYVDGDVIYTYKAIVDGKVGTIDTTIRGQAKGLFVIANYSGDYASTLTPATAGVEGSTPTKYVYAYGITGSAAVKSAIESSAGTIITKTAGLAGNGIAASSYVTTDDVAVIAVNDSTGSAAAVTADDMNYYKNITGYSLIMDRDGFVATVIFTYGVQ